MFGKVDSLGHPTCVKQNLSVGQSSVQLACECIEQDGHTSGEAGRKSVVIALMEGVT